MATKIPSYFLHSLLLLALGLGCGSGNNSSVEEGDVSADIKAYWLQGKAEVTNYHLKQARYGEVHEGHAVLVYVTEDFSLSKQVKLDRPDQHQSDAAKVLKLNLTKKFNTGIYPYSMMQSVFTPLQLAEHKTLKVTSSTQEWCGQTYTQLNLKRKQYEGVAYSYFESEGDRNVTLKSVVLEDEIWNWIRLQPTRLPIGDVEMIRGTFASRLQHLPMQVERVDASLQTEQGITTYRIHYTKDKRTLLIRFREEFPHEIVGWEETYVSGWGEAATTLTTTATLNKRIKIDYWTKNKRVDTVFRKELGLP
jgi:hypothetical protein